jgi:hypothetical protein
MFCVLFFSPKKDPRTEVGESGIDAGRRLPAVKPVKLLNMAFPVAPAALVTFVVSW